MKISICIALRRKQTRTHEEKAKSLILSTAYEIDEVCKGKTVVESTAIGDVIRPGRSYEFNPDAIQEVIVSM